MRESIEELGIPMGESKNFEKLFKVTAEEAARLEQTEAASYHLGLASLDSGLASYQEEAHP